MAKIQSPKKVKPVNPLRRQPPELLKNLYDMRDETRKNIGTYWVQYENTTTPNEKKNIREKIGHAHGSLASIDDMIKKVEAMEKAM